MFAGIPENINSSNKLTIRIMSNFTQDFLILSMKIKFKLNPKMRLQNIDCVEKYIRNDTISICSTFS